MIRIIIHPDAAKAALRAANAATADLTPAMRLVSQQVERIVRRRFDESRDPQGKAWPALYPRPETQGRKPLVKEGTLRDSILGTFSPNEARIGTELLHARILNAGGTTRGHVIRPRRARALRFYDESGNVIFRRSGNHPGSRIPAREFMSLSVTEEGEVVKIVGDHVGLVLERVR